MFGISGGEFLILLVVAAFVLGPKNVAEALRGLRKVTDALRGWSAKLRNEAALGGDLGISAEDLAFLKELKLRELDPRSVVRQAVQEEMKAWADVASTSSKAMNQAGGSLKAMQASPSQGSPPPTQGPTSGGAPAPEASASGETESKES